MVMPPSVFGASDVPWQREGQSAVAALAAPESLHDFPAVPSFANGASRRDALRPVEADFMEIQAACGGLIW
ncbi:Putative uncharacterized protein (plasmid) [Mesorhizobium loti]|nr:Putative uncharacterized protein [Mesorhizobium loti]